MIIDFFKAVAVGLAGSIPLGPIGVLCIQKTISKGKWSGISLGIGTAFSDMIYAILALFSLAFINDFIDQNRIAVILAGGVIITAFGVSIIFKNPIKQMRHPKPMRKSGYITDGLQGFLMAITNPGAMVLLLSLFTFAHFDSRTMDSPLAVVILPLGVISGCVIWWYILCSFINRFRNKFRIRHLLLLNRLCGIAIAAFGVVAVAGGLYSWLAV